MIHVLQSVDAIEIRGGGISNVEQFSTTSEIEYSPLTSFFKSYKIIYIIFHGNNHNKLKSWTEATTITTTTDKAD